jgi:mRNA-degrading endonuclease toxin of MazEF toxin-antitoxin module
LPKPSVVVVSQIATVDKSRLLEKIGSLPKQKLAQVIDGSRTVISQKVFD